MKGDYSVETEEKRIADELSTILAKSVSIANEISILTLGNKSKCKLATQEEFKYLKETVLGCKSDIKLDLKLNASKNGFDVAKIKETLLAGDKSLMIIKTTQDEVLAYVSDKAKGSVAAHLGGKKFTGDISFQQLHGLNNQQLGYNNYGLELNIGIILGNELKSFSNNYYIQDLTANFEVKEYEIYRFEGETNIVNNTNNMFPSYPNVNTNLFQNYPQYPKEPVSPGFKY